jgi:hypothetical protein
MSSRIALFLAARGGLQLLVERLLRLARDPVCVVS